MFADAAQRLMRLYGVSPGSRAVIATANRFGYDAALDLLDAGIEVAAIVDLRQTADGSDGAAARARGIRIMPNATLVAAKGRRHVSAVAVASITGRGQAWSHREWIDCDLVLMSAATRRRSIWRATPARRSSMIRRSRCIAPPICRRA